MMFYFKPKPSQLLGSFSFSQAMGLAAITLAGLALRVFHIGLQPLWADEGYSLFFATRDLPTLLDRTALDIHPPLYYVALQAWMALFGKTDIAARMLSVLIGVATIPLLYLLVKRLFGNARLALVTAALLAASPFHIYYSQEIRMYGMVTLLGLASFCLLFELMSLPAGRPKTALVAASYIVVTTAALYTQYYAALLIAAQMVLVILSVRSRQSSVGLLPALLHWLAAWSSIAILYLPWIVYAGPKLYSYVTAKVTHESYPPLDPVTFLAQHAAAFAVGHVTQWGWLAWASVLLVGLATVGVWQGFGRRSPRVEVTDMAVHGAVSPTLFMVTYLTVPAVLAYLVNLPFPFHPAHNERLLLIAAPAFYTLAAIGLLFAFRLKRLAGVLVLAGVALISAASLYDFYTVERYSNDDYRPLIAKMQELAQPGDVVLAVYPWQIGYLETYYAGAPLTIVETPSDRWINNPGQMQAQVDQLRQQHARLWLPAYQMLGRLLEDTLDRQLRQNDYSVYDGWFGTTRLELFAAAPDPVRSGKPLSFRDGTRAIDVSDWGISEQPVESGSGVVRIMLRWDDLPAGVYKTSVRLVDARGNPWAQDDRDAENGVQRVGLPVPAGTPPGEYDLRMTMYRSRDLAVLGDGGDSVSLGHVTIKAPPAANLAAVPNHLAADLGDGLRVVGYDAPGRVLRPGETSALALYWQASRPSAYDFTTSVQVQDAGGHAYASVQAPPAGGLYPSSRWQPGELVRDPQTLTLDGDTPDGEYRLVVAAVRPDGTRSAPVTIGTVQVKGRPHYYGAPSPAHAVNARFENVARLVGYNVTTEPGAVRLALYWQSVAPTRTSFKVYAHLVDASGTLRGQKDQVPGEGAYPTTGWVKGEYLGDLYVIPLPSDATGAYQIEIGMYEPTTGARLAAFSAADEPLGDHVTLTVPR